MKAAIEVRKAPQGGAFLFMPLGPSTNERMQPMCVRQLHEFRSRSRRFGAFHRAKKVPKCAGIQQLSTKARTYIRRHGAELRAWVKKSGWEPIERLTWLKIWIVLPRINCDPHNYEKILFDTLEEGGICVDDRYVLPDYQAVAYDSKEPGLVIGLNL